MAALGFWGVRNPRWSGNGITDERVEGDMRRLGSGEVGRDDVDKREEVVLDNVRLCD